MRALRRTTTAAVGALALGVCLASAQEPRAADLLDRYLRGAFDDVVAVLETHTRFDWLVEQLRRDAAGWIEAGEPSTRGRRRLAAATLALEAARLGQWTAWKHREEFPTLDVSIRWVDENGRPYIPEILYWAPPARLVEWGCEIMRRDDEPGDAGERLWHLAALAVAQRSEDGEFLFSEGLNTKLYNPDAEINHLLHSTERMPDEPRFRLAAGIALEWAFPERALKEFEGLQNHAAVGAEATLRLGSIHGRQRREARAVEAFDEVERRTRDPWLLYLARYLKGQALERRHRPADAERAYRDALAAVPAAQSATLALSALLTRRGQRSEAGALVRAMFDQRPPVPDPWRGYVHADDRFWPVLLARLRAEIRR